jgi:hypothetical protein
MTEAAIPGPLTPDPIRPADKAKTAASAQTKGAEGAAKPEFQVLLERLQQRALELEVASRDAEAPEHMARAVDSAQASLEEAQTLSDRLLEAFREASHQNGDAEAAQREGGRESG